MTGTAHGPLVPPSGPVPARLMLIGEAPGEWEVKYMRPFVGASGQLLDKAIAEAGLLRGDCFITNVVRVRPPGNNIEYFIPKLKRDIRPDMVALHGRMVDPIVAQGLDLLHKEIDMVKPELIIALGGTALWALTGHKGIEKWRSSILQLEYPGPVVAKLIPTLHPAAVLRQQSDRVLFIHDLKRARKELTRGRRVVPPPYQFIIAPTFPQVAEWLAPVVRSVADAPTRLAVDIETRAGQIACIGIAHGKLDALCIPLMQATEPYSYWSEFEELALTLQLRDLFTHPNCQIIGQNFLYDAQYFAKQYGYVPRVLRDTMITQNVLFPGMSKGLDFLSSLYCDFHVYWKDEGKDWHVKMPEAQLWGYNCKDAVITYEVDEAQQELVARVNLGEVLDFQQELFMPVLRMMLRGVRVDLALRDELRQDLTAAIDAREGWLARVLGHPLNIKSPQQMAKLFYGDLSQRVIRNRKTGTPTLQGEALQTIGKREPLLLPLTRTIEELRSLHVFRSTFIDAKLDADQRLRCSFNVAGTETFRFTSSKDAFGSGLNLQTIPSGTEDN